MTMTAGPAETMLQAVACPKNALTRTSPHRFLKHPLFHHVPARQRAFCPSRRLRHASGSPDAGDDPVNEGDPTGLRAWWKDVLLGPIGIVAADVWDSGTVADVGTCLGSQCYDTHEGAVDLGEGFLNAITSLNPNEGQRVSIPAEYPCVPGAYQIGEGLFYGASLVPGALLPGADEAEGAELGEQALGAETARGLSPLGGVIEETGTNAAGGRIFTSTGAINQNDFAGIVNSGLMRGEEVHILTGAHGLADGSLVADPSLFADDVARFGDMPGVSVQDVMSMSPAEIKAVLQGPGTIIGGFCDSGACLARYGG